MINFIAHSLINNRMRIIGCMSGTSLDGMDLAFCQFSEQEGIVVFEIIKAKTYSYSSTWKKRLKSSMRLSALELLILDKDFGELTAELICEFIEEFRLKDIDYIASHGHTVFHQPEQQLTLQIGNGISIAEGTNISVINDFRSLDVALGGQGAPLVPVGDRQLFSDYDYCLNLGGFSNVSFEKNGQRIAYDIAPANLVFNFFAEKLGVEFDENGSLGEKGELDYDLLRRLNRIAFYEQSYPKSLGKEWLDAEFLPIISSQMKNADILRTLYEHVAIQVATVLVKENSKTLITGGGAFNGFLIKLIREKSHSEIIIPNNEIIDFKEALIFDFLGYLRIKNRVNVLKSVTGAFRDSCSGNVIYP